MPHAWSVGVRLRIWGCPRMEDTLLVYIFGKFDFPVPKFGIGDAGSPERIIRRIAEDYVGFVGMGIANMELIHFRFPPL